VREWFAAGFPLVVSPPGAEAEGLKLGLDIAELGVE